jgi:hypothetical protein
LVLFPYYFVVITAFALWPWRRRPPYGTVLRLLGIQERSRNASELRFLMLRLSMRTSWASTVPGPVRVRSVVGWAVRPFSYGIGVCWRLSRAERERSGLSWPASTALFLQSVPDLLRFDNGYGAPCWFYPERRADAGFQIPSTHHVRIAGHLLNHANDPSLPVTQRHFDKAELYRTCREHGWATIPVHVLFEDGTATNFEPIEAGPLLSKPTSLAEGVGSFERWRPESVAGDDTPRYRRDDGRVVSLDELMDHLSVLSRDTPYMLQPLLRPHRAIRELSGADTLSTVRIMTCCFPDGRAELIPIAFTRMPLDPDAMVDNRAQGALAFYVDPDTGALGLGSLKHTAQVYDTHPVSQRAVEGFVLPYFQDALDLVTEAHAEAFSRFPTLGWDVALTDDGPVIVEMNVQWACQIGDIPGQPFLGQTVYTDCVLAHMRRHWPHACPEAWGSLPFSVRPGPRAA